VLTLDARLELGVARMAHQIVAPHHVVQRIVHLLGAHEAAHRIGARAVGVGIGLEQHVDDAAQGR